MEHEVWLSSGLKMASSLLDDVGGREGWGGAGSILRERMWFSLGVSLSLPWLGGGGPSDL